MPLVASCPGLLKQAAMSGVYFETCNAVFCFEKNRASIFHEEWIERDKGHKEFVAAPFLREDGRVIQLRFDP